MLDALAENGYSYKARRRSVESQNADTVLIIAGQIANPITVAYIDGIREVLGAGTITLFPVGNFDGVIELPGLSQSPARVIALAAGALLVMGYLKALFNWMSYRKEHAAAKAKARSKKEQAYQSIA